LTTVIACLPISIDRAVSVIELVEISVTALVETVQISTSSITGSITGSIADGVCYCET